MTFQRRLMFCFLLLVLAAGRAAAQVPVPAAPDLAATSFVLQDFHSGEIIAARDPELQVEPASITKLMTSYVVFRELASGNLRLDESVRISEKAWRTGGSKMFVEVGTEVSVEDLLKGVIIQSGNDASVALAEHVAGTESVFAQMMNAEAQRLGMTGTNYRNSTGLPDADHYTTAADVATLSRALIAEFPEYYAWYSQLEFTFNDIRQTNRNLLLRRDDSVDGLKTGHTEAAGYCLATSAQRDGMRLISVVMGTASENARAEASQSLLNYGFRFFETFKLYSAGEELTRAEVWKGALDEMALGVAGDVFLTVPRGRQDRLAAELVVPRRPVAPFSEGQDYGTLQILLDGELELEQPLVVMHDVPEAGWWGRTTDGIGLWFGGLFGGDD
ncbi:D-alanyl-D-alanine carboxypeptidase [Wenzhouxiangella sp. XN79A]|uniref:D-alanyl-D-alanine carboxypeptidase family protein n=1 Tax=Wenzhouxiangella sp. XN79A TaxID=2724193 RepID=UPI00144A8075|nr:D-alanyl-D-alanine carboxypeptidase family protein [Wenzhouxiangella sp. XN79A]NKI33958.1 D-alanyl-D-alanine carboxypeptidase [Wenzhouxiangella sp. XN79A]